MDSFEMFLKSIGEDKVEESGTGEDSYAPSVIGSDNLYTAKPFGVESTSEEEMEELMPDVLEETEEGEAEVDDDEGDEGDEGEESLYEIEEWESQFQLPDGSIVDGAMLKDFQNYQLEKAHFEDTKAKYSIREKEVVANADIGMRAISAMKDNLLRSAQNGTITEIQVAQAQVLDFMETQFNNFSAQIKDSYSNEIHQQEARKQEMLDNNINACFEQYKDFQHDVPVLKEYIQSKGFDADSFLMDIGYNPKIVSMLMDASTIIRANKKIISPNQANVVKGIRTSSESKNTARKDVIPDGISSHDASSYKAFSQLGIH